MPILYCGEIGIIDDIKHNIDDKQFISLDDNLWLDSIERIAKNDQRTDVSSEILDYFDMTVRQNETIEILESTFKNRKVR